MSVVKTRVGNAWATTGVGSSAYPFHPGPTGQKKPWNWNFAYSKAATVTVSSLSALQSAIQTAGTGDVIEVTTDLLGGTYSNPLTITGGTNTLWADGILVRPPVGTRGQLDHFAIKAHNVIMAGWDFSGRLRSYAQDFSVNGAQTQGCGFWRCVGNVRGATMVPSGSTSSAICECVIPLCHFNSTSDQVDAYADGNCDLVNPIFDGCYFAGNLMGTGSVYASLTASSVSNGTYTTTASGSGTAVSLLFAFPGLGSTTADLEVKVNGLSVWTGSAPEGLSTGGDIADFTTDYSLSIAITSGDTVSVTISNLSGAMPNLMFWIGGNEGTHLDTIQFGHAQRGSQGYAGGKVRDAMVIDSVMRGSENTVITTDITPDSDTRFIGCWFGRGKGYGSSSASLNLSGVNSNPTKRVHLLNCRFTASIPYLTSGQVITCMYNQANGSTLVGNGFDSTNTDNAGFSASPPALADLTAIWPECPSTAVLDQ